MKADIGVLKVDVAELKVDVIKLRDDSTKFQLNMEKRFSQLTVWVVGTGIGLAGIR